MIYLMRHGETVWNAARRLQGRKDSPLTPKGVAQATAFGDKLKDLLPGGEPCRILSSPQPRAWQTAVLAVAGMGRDPGEIVHDDRLMEHSFGAWEGLLWSDVQRDHADALARRMADKWNAPAPDGESYRDVADRVAAWLADIDPAAVTVVFCHGVTARVMRGLYANLPRNETMSLAEPQDRIFRLAGGRIDEIAA